MSGKVEHPTHYFPGVYEVYKVIDAWKLCFKLGNAIKYIARAGKKSKATEVEDLQKAKFYIDLKIEEVQKREADQASDMTRKARGFISTHEDDR